MKLAMTSIAVTASVCASASEAAFLVASFIQFSLDLGMTHRCVETQNDVRNFTRNTPRRVFAGLSPHSGEYRRLSDSNSNAAAFWLACSRFMRSQWNFESDFRA